MSSFVFLNKILEGFHMPFSQFGKYIDNEMSDSIKARHLIEACVGENSLIVITNYCNQIIIHEKKYFFKYYSLQLYCKILICAIY